MNDPAARLLRIMEQSCVGLAGAPRKSDSHNLHYGIYSYNITVCALGYGEGAATTAADDALKIVARGTVKRTARQPMIEKAGTGRLRARLGPGGRMPRSSPEAVVSPSPTSFFLVPCSLPLAPCPLPIWRRGRSSSSRARCENWAAGNFDIADLAVRWVVPLVVTSFVALRRQRVTRSNRVGYATKSMPYISASVLK